MTSWLNKQRKNTLLELSEAAGLKQDADGRKDELVESLDSYLQKNATRLSRNPTFEPYYGTRRTPFKARSSSAAGGVTSGDDTAGDVKSVVKARGKKTTKVKVESDPDAAFPSPTNALATVKHALSTRPTPAPQRRRSEIIPSPADVADDVEYAANRFYSGLDDLYTLSGIPETIEYLRELCSSVAAVQLTCLLLEAYGLQSEIFPWRYAFDIPSLKFPFINIATPNVAVKLPDLFILLTGYFWSTTLLWSLTSILIPLLFAYFYNLSMHTVRRHGARVNVTRYPADPLTFNIIKAVVTQMVYGHRYTFGLFDEHAIYRADRGFIGGFNGVMTGAYIGIVAAIYEACQRK